MQFSPPIIVTDSFAFGKLSDLVNSISFREQGCSVLGKSHLGAKRNFEIWAFKVFFFGHQKHPLEWLLEAQTWISKLVRIHRRFLTMHELGSNAGLFFQHFLLNSRRNKLKDLAKLKDFSLNSSIFLPKLKFSAILRE